MGNRSNVIIVRLSSERCSRQRETDNCHTVSEQSCIDRFSLYFKLINEDKN